MKLYVGNLAFQTTSQELQELFAQAGTVQSASVVEDRETGRSRGFAFVEMSSNAEGAAAIDQFNGKELGGRALKVRRRRWLISARGSSEVRTQGLKLAHAFAVLSNCPPAKPA